MPCLNCGAQGPLTRKAGLGPLCRPSGPPYPDAYDRTKADPLIRACNARRTKLDEKENA